MFIIYYIMYDFNGFFGTLLPDKWKFMTMTAAPHPTTYAVKLYWGREPSCWGGMLPIALKSIVLMLQNNTDCYS